MATMMQENRYALSARELLALDRAENHVVTCLGGELWLTVGGDQRDIILRAGDHWAIENAADCVVISALQASVLAITRPATSSREPRRIGAAWILASLLRWKHEPLAAMPANLLR